MRGPDSWVAIGDSFTEGLSDLSADGVNYVGWADRLAEMLAARNPAFRYANLALRGKMLQEIIDEQLPFAMAAKPDLVTICAGGNDVVTPGSDVDWVADKFEQAIAELAAAVPTVVIFTGPDPKALPLVRTVRGKVAIYNGHVRGIADRHGVKLVDLWSMDVLHDRRAWSDDRLHFSAEGHRRIALCLAEMLGIPINADWRQPWPPASPSRWLSSRRDDLNWTRTHLLPWVRRQIQGTSMGDGLAPKRPELTPLADERARREMA
ncbi:SGNH/GDSL hydrolase family protein [Herbihabitans rhizosphaerae]|uniref:SGNH/GDSL hydrolase family protein n=1 Tax=Herbihabitans rhizosphaerae TaxID=1872711 RepID=UPI00102BF2CB|nr:SGNH/GDSL hydrolase family protein [Herbihabitans rhizosphaerae]